MSALFLRSSSLQAQAPVSVLRPDFGPAVRRENPCKHLTRRRLSLKLFPLAVLPVCSSYRDKFSVTPWRFQSLPVALRLRLRITKLCAFQLTSYGYNGSSALPRILHFWMCHLKLVQVGNHLPKGIPS